MYRERKEDLSLVQFLQESFTDVPFVKIVEGYQITGLVVPSVSIHPMKIDCPPIEMGNSITDRVRTYEINIYATSDAQRLDFAYRLLNRLDLKIPVYNYDEGFPPNITPSTIDCLNVIEKQVEFLEVNPELTTVLYYRTIIYFVVERSKI